MRTENYPFEGGVPQSSEVLHLISDVVAAYVSNNNIEPTEILPLIHQVYATLTNLGHSGGFAHMCPLEAAVPIKKSVTDDHVLRMVRSLKC